MSLTDKETLELNELCNALTDGVITPAQQTRLSEMLHASEEARRFYVRHSALSASLFDYAGEMQNEQPAEADKPRGRLIFFPRYSISALAAAAALVLATATWLLVGRENNAEAAGDVDTEELVARLTGSQECQWGNTLPAIPTGAHLHQGQRIELEKGIAEITFDCGAQIVLEGPASLDVNSPWEATLHRGTLHAIVPPAAIGFRVLNPSVEVVDLGTEFTMSADASGAADVFVTKGVVETTPRNADGGNAATITLQKDEGRRFSKGGVAKLDDGAKKYGSFKFPAKMSRFLAPVHFAHWAFDENDGMTAIAQKSEGVTTSLDATLAGDGLNATTSFRTAGRWNNALAFDGKLFAKAPFPTLSTDSPRTIAFWMRVPSDAQLSDASPAVGWISKGGGKIPSHPVAISWNTSPAQGPLGALRTEFGRGQTVGTSNLRDGQWHHIAVVFVPNERNTGRVHVKQYVDGRLEQPGLRRAKKTKREMIFAHTANAPQDTLVLGHRLDRSRASSGNFRGALDELFIADRALTPMEIQRLVTENKIVSAELVAQR